MSFVAVLLASLALTPATSTEAPVGFRDAKLLTPAASYVAGKPVKVWCATTLTSWGAELDRRRLPDVRGFALIAAGAAYLSPEVCRPLEQQLRGTWKLGAEIGRPMATLVHEAVHLTGLRDEGETECRALKLLPVVAIKYFRYTPHRAPLRALVREAWYESAYRDGPCFQA